MKKSIFTLLLVAMTALFTNDIAAQKFRSIDKSPLDIVSYSASKNSKILAKVTYSRPFLKGREVSSLAKNGKVWRTGANEAVEIRFYEDVIIGGKEVEEGTYSLFTIPGENEWTFIISKATNGWGSYGYDEKNDVLRATGKVSKNSTSLENFSMAFEKDMTLCLGWGDVIVKLPISVEKED